MSKGTPPPARHGKWNLAMAGEVDRRIRELFGLQRGVEEIASQLGVATGYVEAFIRDEYPDEKPAPRPRAELPAIEAPTALSRVLCIVAGEEIGARDCISRQCSSNCFCPKASFAINAIAPHAPPGSKLDEQLARCRTVARSVLTKPEIEERFLGPALAAYRGEKVEEQLITGELPVPPAAKVAARSMSAPPEKHSQPDPILPAPPAPPPPVAKEKPMPRIAPPPPVAKEKPMPRISKLDSMSDEQLRAIFEKAGSVSAMRREIQCGMKPLQDRMAKILASSRKVVAAGQVLKDNLAPIAPDQQADIDPVAQLLVQQREQLELRIADFQKQIARIDRAIAAISA